MLVVFHMLHKKHVQTDDILSDCGNGETQH